MNNLSIQLRVFIMSQTHYPPNIRRLIDVSFGPDISLDITDHAEMS